MKFCGKCGTQVDDNIQFCPSCGNSMGQPAQQPQQPQQNQNYGAVPPMGAPAQQQNTAQGGKNFFQKLLDTPDYTAQFDPADVQSTKGASIAAYFGILFFVPLAVNGNSKYGRFHANQGLVFLIASAILGVVSFLIQLLFNSIFVSEVTVWGVGTGVYATNGFGHFLSGLFGFVLALPSLAWFILGLINSINGRAKELPIIGKLRIIK